MRLAFVALAVAVAGAACGDDGRSGPGQNGEYPLVVETRPEYQPAVTTEGGAVVQRPAPPSEHEVAASPTCERVLATFHDGSAPSRRPIVIPPRPGLRAKAISTHEVELEWSFSALPDDCRPTTVRLSVVASADVAATPTNTVVGVNGSAGTARITYPDFLAPPDVAIASAYSRDGRRSRAASVLINR